METPCIQFEYFKDFNFLTDYRVHILVVSFYAMANIHQRAGLRSAFCLYGTCFHFFGDTLFIRQMHAGNNAADKCGRQIQQIQVINPTNLAARGNLAPIGAGSWQWRGAISASFTSSQSPSDWQLDNPLRLTSAACLLELILPLRFSKCSTYTEEELHVPASSLCQH